VNVLSKSLSLGDGGLDVVDDIVVLWVLTFNGGFLSSLNILSDLLNSGPLGISDERSSGVVRLEVVDDLTPGSFVGFVGLLGIYSEVDLEGVELVLDGLDEIE